jgi:hypothetical protein
VKFLLSTGERLLGFGAWESAAGDSVVPRNGRVYFSPVLDTSEVEDDERVSNTLSFKGYIDVSRDAGAEDRAIIGPVDGQIFVFQSRGVWMLVPTSNAQQPYRRITMSNLLGAVSQPSCFTGEDESGQSCLYFLDPERGPYRYGFGGFQWLGYDVQDLWATVNLAATSRVAVGAYDAANRRCIWLVATGSSNDPDTGLVFHVREGQPTEKEGVRYGWTKWTGDLCAARTMVMFSETIGATMSRNLKPYMGFASSLLRGEDSSATNDAGTAFQSYVTSKAWNIEPLTTKKRLGKAYLQAKTGAGVTVRLSMIRNYGDETNRTADQLLTASGSETRIMKNFEGIGFADAWSFQFRVGDSAAVANAWTLDHVLATIEPTVDEVGNNMP